MPRKPTIENPGPAAPPPHDRAAIEAKLGQIRAEIAELGGMMRDYGSERLKGVQAAGAEHLGDETLAELQRQLAALETDVTRRVREQPMQSLGLAALAGLIVGLILRR